MKLILCIITVFLFSCGYQWGNKGESLPGGYKKIAVPVFLNRSAEVGAEVFFTNAVIRKLAQSSVTEVVKREYADVVLEGSIDEVKMTRSGDIDSDSKSTLPEYVVLSSTYNMVIKVSMVLRLKKDGTVLWSNSFETSTSYNAAQVGAPVINTVNPLYNHSAKYENLSSVADDLMATAYTNMTENF